MGRDRLPTPTIAEANEALAEAQRAADIRALRSEQQFYRDRYRRSGPLTYIVTRLEAIAAELRDMGETP